jgi:hypothetical protein
VKADPLSVGKVLTENHRFVVPIYQRTYAKPQTQPCFLLVERNVNSPFCGRALKLGEGMANDNFGQISSVLVL